MAQSRCVTLTRFTESYYETRQETNHSSSRSLNLMSMIAVLLFVNLSKGYQIIKTLAFSPFSIE